MVGKRKRRMSDFKNVLLPDCDMREMEKNIANMTHGAMRKTKQKASTVVNLSSNECETNL